MTTLGRLPPQGIRPTNRSGTGGTCVTTRTGCSPNSKPLRNVAELPIVYVEPWPIYSITPKVAILLSDIVYGKYDNVIRTHTADIKKFGSPVNMRLGHEMEATARSPLNSIVGHVVSTRSQLANDSASVAPPCCTGQISHGNRGWFQQRSGGGGSVTAQDSIQDNGTATLCNWWVTPQPHRTIFSTYCN
jgi:hypothetical protein